MNFRNISLRSFDGSKHYIESKDKHLIRYLLAKYWLLISIGGQAHSISRLARKEECRAPIMVQRQVEKSWFYFSVS